MCLLRKRWRHFHEAVSGRFIGRITNKANVRVHEATRRRSFIGGAAGSGYSVMRIAQVSSTNKLNFFRHINNCNLQHGYDVPQQQHS